MIILTKYLMKMPQSSLRMKKKYGNPENNEQSYDEILNTDISELEVKKAIQRLKSGKAAGVDGVIAETLKAAEQKITHFLTRYFNVLFSNSRFPSEWTKAVIIPLYKKGDVSNPDNYRKISLLSIFSIISKVYTHTHTHTHSLPTAG